jgi:TPR repeat protein
MHTFYPYSHKKRNIILTEKHLAAAACLGATNAERRSAVFKLQEFAEQGRHDAWIVIHEILHIHCIENGMASTVMDDFYSVSVSSIFQGLHKSAKRGNTQAQGWLGIQYRGGIYGIANNAAAEKWLRIAALNGCLASQYNLAVFLMTCSESYRAKTEAKAIYHSLLNLFKKNIVMRPIFELRHLKALENLIQNA